MNLSGMLSFSPAFIMAAEMFLIIIKHCEDIKQLNLMVYSLVINRLIDDTNSFLKNKAQTPATLHDSLLKDLRALFKFYFK